MRVETSLQYHRRRATAELDLAYRAATRAAMKAHLDLSALHMTRLKDSAVQHPSLPDDGQNAEAPAPAMLVGG